MAADFKALGDTGAYHGHGMASVKLVVKWDVLENMMAPIPNLRYEGYVVYTNKIPGGCMRGIGNIQHNFAMGLGIDMLGEKLGIDPVEIAIKNYGHEWEAGAQQERGGRVPQPGPSASAGSDRHPAGQGPVFEGAKKRGLGFSGNCTWHAAWQEEMRGPRPGPGQAQPGHERRPPGSHGGDRRGLERLRHVRLRGRPQLPGHQAGRHPLDPRGRHRDRPQGHDPDRQLLRVPAAGADAHRRGAAQGRAHQPGGARCSRPSPRRWISSTAGRSSRPIPSGARLVRDMLWFGDMVPVVVTVTQMPDVTKTGAPFAATFAEVEVDTETGKVDVLKHRRGARLRHRDVRIGRGGPAGRQPDLRRGREPHRGDRLRPGHRRAAQLQLGGLPLPTILDFPDVEPVLLEVWQGAGEYGACGMGEGASTSTPRAIANAIYNAIGVRVDEIPIKPEKVLAALAHGGYTVPAPPTPACSSVAEVER